MNLFKATILLVCLGASAIAGDLSGHLLLTRKLTKKQITPLTYNVRGAIPHPSAAEPVAAGEYSRMVVILEGEHPPKIDPVTAVLEQRGGRFESELLVIPVGSTVSFPNADPLFHNVFSLSRTKGFDLGYYPQGHSRTVKFDQPGVVQVYCHIHPNMYSAIVITRSPWHVTPGPDGSFGWQDLPAGSYQVVVWHNTAGLFRRKVSISATGQVDMRLEIPVAVSDQ